VRESLKPGANVSEVARQHGLRPRQLYKWRRRARALIGRSAAREDQVRPAGLRRIGPKSASKTAEALPAFAPVVMATPAVSQRPTASETSLVEIAIGEVSVRVRGVVDVEAIVAVLSAVRRVS
jgi:transposase